MRPGRRHQRQERSFGGTGEDNDLEPPPGELAGNGSETFDRPALLPPSSGVEPHDRAARRNPHSLIGAGGDRSRSGRGHDHRPGRGGQVRLECTQQVVQGHRFVQDGGSGRDRDEFSEKGIGVRPIKAEADLRPREPGDRPVQEAGGMMR